MIKKISITGSSSLLGINVVSLLKKNLLSLSKRKKNFFFTHIGNLKKKDQVFYGNLENKKFVTKFLSESFATEFCNMDSIVFIETLHQLQKCSFLQHQLDDHIS